MYHRCITGDILETYKIDMEPTNLRKACTRVSQGNKLQLLKNYSKYDS